MKKRLFSFLCLSLGILTVVQALFTTASSACAHVANETPVPDCLK